MTEGSSRSSISVDLATKDHFDTLRRQLSAYEDRDMTSDDALSYLMESFEDENDWVGMWRDDG